MFTIGSKNSWIWAIDKPEDVDFKKFVGRHVKVEDEKGNEIGIEIEEIQGSLAHPTKFQINTSNKYDNTVKSYFISMLDFFAQMNGERVSKEEIKLFDESQFHVRRNAYKKDGGLWLPNKIRN